MRTKKMVVNLIAGFGGQLTGSVLSFITRIIIVGDDTYFLERAYGNAWMNDMEWMLNL